MKNVIKCLGNYKLETMLAPLFKMLEAIFELLVPLVVASLIDIGIRQRDERHIWKMCLLLLCFTCVGFLVAAVAQYFSAKAAMGVGTTLRSQMFRKVQYMSFSQLDTVGTATLVNYMTGDIQIVQTGVNLFLRLFLRAPFIVIGATIMAFRVDRSITFVFVAVTLLIIAIVSVILKKTVHSYKKAQERLDALALLIRENHAGARLVRAFDRQADEAKAFEESNQVYTSLQIAAGRISALMNPATYMLMNAAIIFILYTAGPKVETEVLTQGQVVALVNYLMQILLVIVVLANLTIAVTRAIASTKRLEKILDMPLKEEQNKNANSIQKEEQGIVFEQVSFRYEGASEVQLEDVSFSISKGSTVGMIGGTGAGKSTLVNLLPRFYDASEGQIRIDGMDVQAIPVEALRKKMGIVPQQAVLCKGSLRDNLKWGKEQATDEEMLVALKVAQASFALEHAEQGLDMQIEQGGKNLSGGQRQRVSIARALIRKPEILIMDDSDSGLDYLTEAKLREDLRRYTKDTTVIIVSQRISAIQAADNILVFDDGKVVGEGTHERLLESNQVYREIYVSQLKSSDQGRANL